MRRNLNKFKQWTLIKNINMIQVSQIEKAKYFAISRHALQTYNGLPYFYHLEEVVLILKENGFVDDKYIIAGYLHDVLEDCAVSYNEIKKEFGEEIAEIVYCVTDELGRNRKERKKKTYKKIRSNNDAIRIKLADRISNVMNSSSMSDKNSSSMGKLYKEEFSTFKKELYDDNDKEIKLHAMWAKLEILIDKLD